MIDCIASRTLPGLLLLLAQLGCGEDQSAPVPGLGSGIDSAGTDTDATTDDDGDVEEGADTLDLPDDSDLPPIDPEECVSDSAQAELTPKPVDVIVVVDTSGSMDDESTAVEQNLNLLLAAIVEQEMIDVRVIVVALYGAGASMCIVAPLGPDNCTPPGPMAPVGPQLYQYSVGFGSSTFLTLLVDTFTGAYTPTNAALYTVLPNGWQEWARPEALKTFIAVTDAASMSTDPAQGDAFDTALLAASPEQFGTADARNYVFHAITPIAENTPPTAPYPPDHAIVTTTCGAGRPGQPPQQVAILTGGLRFPLCGYENYASLFDEIAVNVADLTPVACDFAIPEAPPGETLDPDTFEVEYLPGGVAPGEVFHQVPSEAECEDDAFWLDDTSIHLCPTACALVQADAMAQVDVRYGCDVGYDPID